MPEKIRWGIFGTGNIAHQFARGLSVAENAELVAVGSRTAEAAAEFADEFGITRYRTPATRRWRTTRTSMRSTSRRRIRFTRQHAAVLERGKAVLCEKPFAMNAREAER